MAVFFPPTEFSFRETTLKWTSHRSPASWITSKIEIIQTQGWFDGFSGYDNIIFCLSYYVVYLIFIGRCPFYIFRYSVTEGSVRSFVWW